MATKDETREKIEAIPAEVMAEAKTLPGVAAVVPKKTVSPDAQVARIQQIQILAPIIRFLNSIDRRGWYDLPVKPFLYSGARDAVDDVMRHVNVAGFCRSEVAVDIVGVAYCDIVSHGS